MFIFSRVANTHLIAFGVCFNLFSSCMIVLLMEMRGRKIFMRKVTSSIFLCVR